MDFHQSDAIGATGTAGAPSRDRGPRHFPEFALSRGYRTVKMEVEQRLRTELQRRFPKSTAARRAFVSLLDATAGRATSIDTAAMLAIIKPRRPHGRNAATKYLRDGAA